MPYKQMHSGLSSIIVLAVGLLYGIDPNGLLPKIFGFSINGNLELSNIFRAIMGLYIGFALYWIFGILNPTYWRAATISNIIFMGGLAVGRILSTLLDGISQPFSLGLLGELALMAWGLYNLRNQKDMPVRKYNNDVRV